LSLLFVDGGATLRSPAGVSSEAFLALLVVLALERAQPGLDDRALVEVRVAGLDRELELVDRELEVALPSVILPEVLMLLQRLSIAA